MKPHNSGKRDGWLLSAEIGRDGIRDVDWNAWEVWWIPLLASCSYNSIMVVVDLGKELGIVEFSEGGAFEGKIVGTNRGCGRSDRRPKKKVTRAISIIVYSINLCNSKTCFPHFFRNNRDTD